MGKGIKESKKRSLKEKEKKKERKSRQTPLVGLITRQRRAPTEVVSSIRLGAMEVLVMDLFSTSRGLIAVWDRI